MSDKKSAPIRVNGEDVGEELIRQELLMLRERYSSEMPREQMQAQEGKIESDARENAVERVLLMQKAREEVSDIRPEEVEARFMAMKQQHGGEEAFNKRFELTEEDEAQIKQDIADGCRLETYIDALSQDVARPTEEDSRAYYEEHIDAYTLPEQVRAAHIVQLPSESLPAEKIYAELLNARERALAGESFDELAEEFTHCQDGSSDLGYFSRGQMVQKFEDVAFSTPIGTCSDVFQTEFGYHILQVQDHRPARICPYEEVRYDIESMIYDEWKNEAIGKVVDQLRAAATIENLEIVKDC